MSDSKKQFFVLVVPSVFLYSRASASLQSCSNSECVFVLECQGTLLNLMAYE